jgi:acid stress-induced BolA-like protein IbaG/YrbA
MAWLRLCLVFILICGFLQPSRAQPIAVSALTLPQGANDIVWDGTRSRFFASSGTNVLMINPETAQIEDTIPIGSGANRIAVSGDGQYLYVALVNASFDSLGMINRYRIQNHSLEAQIALGRYTGVQAMVVLPGQPSSLLVASNDRRVVAFDGSVPRSGIAALSVSSLYVRPSDGALFGIADDAQYPEVHLQVYRFIASSAGVAVAKSVPVDLNWNNNSTVTWDTKRQGPLGRRSPGGFVDPPARLLDSDPDAANKIGVEYSSDFFAVVDYNEVGDKGWHVGHVERELSGAIRIHAVRPGRGWPSVIRWGLWRAVDHVVVHLGEAPFAVEGS